MSTDPKNIEGVAILQRIAAKALDDEDYRQDLIDDPKGELENAGLTLPDDVDVEVLQNTPTKLYFVLPSRPKHDPDLDPEKKRVHHLINWWPV